MLSHHNDRHHHHHGHGPDALNSTMDYSLSDYEQDHENDDHHPHGNHDFPSTTMTGQSPPSTTASWATSSHSVTTNSTRTTTSQNQSIFRSVTPREEDNISRSSSRISKTASSRSSNKRKKKKRKKKQRSYSSDQYRQLQQQQQQQELLLLAETKRRVLYGEQRSQLVLDEDTHVVWDVPPPKPWFLQIFEMKFCISMFCPPVVGGDGTTGETSIPPLQRSPSRSTSKSLSKMRFQRSKDNNTAKTKRSIPRMPLNHNQQHQHQQAQAQHYPNHAPNYHRSHPQQQQLPPQHDPRFSFPQPPSQMPMPMQQHPHAPPHFMYNTTPPPPHPHNHQHHHSNSSNLQNYPPSMYHYPPPPNNNIMRPPPNAHVHSTNKNTMKQRQQQQQHQQQMMFNFQVPPAPHGGVPLQQRVLSYNTCNTQAETSVATSNYNNFNNTNSSGGGGSTPQSYQRHGHKGHGHGAGEDSLHSLTPRSSSSSIVYDYQQYIPPTASMSSSSTMPAVPTTTLRTQPLGPSPPHRHTHHEPQEPSPPLALGVTVVGDNPTNNAAAAPTATTPSSLSSNLTTPSSLQAMQQQQDDLASITNGGSASVMSASAAGRPPLPLDTATGIAVVSATSPPVATSTPTSATGVGGGVGPVSTSSQQSLRRPNSLQRCFSESSQTSTGSRHRRMSAAGSFSQRSLEQILNFDNDDLDDDDDDEDLSTSVNTATQIQNQRHRQPQAQQQQQQNHTKNRNGGSSRRRRNGGGGGDPVRRDSISKQLVEVNCNFNNGMFDDGYVSPLENDEYSFSNGKSNTPNVTTSAKGTDTTTSPTKAMQQPQKQLGTSKKKKHSQKENGDNHSMSPSKQTQIALHEQRRYSKKTSSSPETNHSSSSGSAGGSPTREAAKSTITLSQSSIGKSALPMVDTTVKDDDVGVVHEDGQDQEEEEHVYKYLPKCQLLEDEQTQVPSNDILISGWVAFSIGDIGFHKDSCTMNANKGVASAAATDTNDNDETAAEATVTTTQDGIQPCDLAYLMISSSKSSLVFLQPQVKKKSMDDNNTNDKDDMVVQEVDLSRTMTVDTHLVSNRHGYAVVLKYQKYDLEQETFISQTICTILPVSLSNHFFEDSQHHQTLVSPRKFQKYQCSMFAPFVIWKNSNDDNDADDDDKHHEKGKGQQGSGSSELEAATTASMLVKPSSSIRSVQRHPYHHSLSQPSQQNPGDFETEESSSLWIGQEYAPDAQTDAVTHIRFVLDTMVRECRT